MSDENKKLGAPAEDDTSALFVSARKKQLAQQEEERKRQQEELKRYEAEAEVRRLEEDVQARKRAAEEEARRIQEEAQAARETGGSAAKAAEAVSGALGGVSKAAKGVAAKIEKKDSGGGFKITPKLLAIAGGAVALVAVVVIVIVVATSGGGTPANKAVDDSALLITLESFGKLSEADQATLISQAMDRLVAEELEPLFEDPEAQSMEILASARSAQRELEVAGSPIYTAQGGFLWMVSYAYDSADWFNNYLRENVEYTPVTPEEIAQMSMLDFNKLSGDAYVASLFAAYDYLLENESYLAEKFQAAPVRLLENVESIRHYTAHVLSMDSATAIQPMGVVALVGFAISDDPAPIEALTSFEAGILAAIPSSSDPLTETLTVAGLGYTLKYPATMKHSGSRTTAMLNADSTYETACVMFSFSEDTIMAQTEDEYEEELLLALDGWVSNLADDGMTLQWENIETEFIADENEIAYYATAYAFNKAGERTDLYSRAAVINDKVYAMIVLAPPDRLEEYKAIGKNIRLSMNMLT